jgi:hypothetical protein
MVLKWLQSNYFTGSNFYTHDLFFVMGQAARLACVGGVCGVHACDEVLL